MCQYKKSQKFTKYVYNNYKKCYIFIKVEIPQIINYKFYDSWKNYKNISLSQPPKTLGGGVWRNMFFREKKGVIEWVVNKE